jgi:hypothetical protein
MWQNNTSFDCLRVAMEMLEQSGRCLLMSGSRYQPLKSMEGKVTKIKLIQWPATTTSYRSAHREVEWM